MRVVIFTIPAEREGEFDPMTFIETTPFMSFTPHERAIPAAAVEADDQPREKWSANEQTYNNIIKIDGKSYDAEGVCRAIRKGEVKAEILNKAAAGLIKLDQPE